MPVFRRSTKVQDAVTAQRLAVVLDPYAGGLGGSEGVDAERVRQRAVVQSGRLGDQEPDQFKTVQSVCA